MAPLDDVATAAARIGAGGLQTRLPPTDDPDLATIVGSFNSMVEALDERIQRDARFAADLGHELRSPLTALVASVQVIERRRDDLPPRTQRALDLVTVELDRFQQTLEDLLELGRLDAGVAHPGPHPGRRRRAGARLARAEPPRPRAAARHRHGPRAGADTAPSASTSSSSAAPWSTSSTTPTGTPAASARSPSSASATASGSTSTTVATASPRRTASASSSGSSAPGPAVRCPGSGLGLSIVAETASSLGRPGLVRGRAGRRRPVQHGAAHRAAPGSQPRRRSPTTWGRGDVRSSVCECARPRSAASTPRAVHGHGSGHGAGRCPGPARACGLPRSSTPVQVPPAEVPYGLLATPHGQPDPDADPGRAPGARDDLSRRRPAEARRGRLSRCRPPRPSRCCRAC